MSKAQKEYYEPPCDSDDDCDDIGCFRVRRANGQLLAGRWCEKHADDLVSRLNSTESEGDSGG